MIKNFFYSQLNFFSLESQGILYLSKLKGYLKIIFFIGYKKFKFTRLAIQNPPSLYINARLLRFKINLIYIHIFFTFWVRGRAVTKIIIIIIIDDDITVYIIINVRRENIFRPQFYASFLL